MIEVIGDRLKAKFDTFGPQEYDLFLKAKRLPEYGIAFDPEAFTWTIDAPARFAHMLGVENAVTRRDRLPMPSFLFDDQVAITNMALDAKRFACWSGCGLGKTLIQTEFARQVCHQTGGRFLQVTLNDIVPQTIEEAKRFYGDDFPIIHLPTRAAMKHFCAEGPKETIGITNYEKFNHESEADQVVNELRHLAGVGLDESSRLKTGGGKQKWALIKSCRGIEYKLSCTATPAPNEIMEFASQASFLEKMRSENDIIWTYFRRDEKTHRWTVKAHARKAFFEFMSSWSIYVRDPRAYGWRTGIEFPPDPIEIRHEIPMTEEQRAFVMEHNQLTLTSDQNTASMFAQEATATSIAKLSQAAKGFVYTGTGRTARPIASLKPAKVAEIVSEDASSGLQVLVWTVFDAESDIVAGEIKRRISGDGVDILTGATKAADRIAMLERFRHGQSRVLVTRARMLGYGMNFQCCGSMVFSGWDFSFESFYQAVRRAVRFGQKRAVRVHIPFIAELEGQMLDAIGRKDRQHDEAVREMEENYIEAMKRLHGIKV